MYGFAGLVGQEESSVPVETPVVLPMPPTTKPIEPCNPGEYKAVKGECGAYIFCKTNRQSSKTYCSEGLHWMQETLSCDWAAKSNCQDYPGTQSIYRVTYYKEGSECSAGSPGLVPNPEDCGSYLICDQDKFVRQPCPASLHWDPKISACNFPEAANCQPGVGQSPQKPVVLPIEVEEEEEDDRGSTQ
jgi:hypothetical protein